MKKTLLTLAVMLGCYSTYAQTNKLNATGNVGIGTANPISTLQVSGVTILSNPNGNNYDENLRLPPSSVGDYSSIALGAIPGAVGTGVGQWSLVRFPAIYNYMFTLRYNSTDYLNVLTNGNVGIGTSTPDTKLAVNGDIHSKSVIVDMKSWPDYVFSPKYNLLPLEEVKLYIDKNQHLPEIPSADEVAKEGLSLGEMNKLLVKKVEELTLYLIELKKESEALKQLQKETNEKLVRNHIN